MSAGEREGACSSVADSEVGSGCWIYRSTFPREMYFLSSLRIAASKKLSALGILMFTSNGAAEKFVGSRIVEGEHLKEDLTQKLDGMLKLVDFITERSPGIIEEFNVYIQIPVVYRLHLHREFPVIFDDFTSAEAGHPEVFTMEDAGLDEEELWKELQKTLDGAADSFRPIAPPSDSVFFVVSIWLLSLTSSSSTHTLSAKIVTSVSSLFSYSQP